MCRSAKEIVKNDKKIIKDVDPETEEIEACRHFLINKIRYIKPKLIIALGKIATNWFYPDIDLERGVIYRWYLGEPMNPNDINNKQIYNRQYKLLHLFHPAALLYNPSNKQEMEKHLLGNIKLIQKIRNI